MSSDKTKAKTETKPEEDGKLLQRVYERRLKGSRRSRRQTRHGSAASSRDSSGHRRGSQASQQAAPYTRPNRGYPPPLKIFPPRPLSVAEKERLATRLPSPQIVVTPPPPGETASVSSDVAQPKILGLVRRLSKEHLKPPPRKKHRQGHKHKTSSQNITGQTSKTLAKAIREQSRAAQSGRPVQIKLTKSHAALRVRHHRHKTRREKWTKEEIDWEWKELLWRMNILGKVYMGFADLEYRIIRFGFKYEGLLIPYLVIFLMFFLPFAIYWDYVAIIHYEVPQFTFIRRVGCITLVHFLAVLMNTYCYIQASLQNKRPRLRFFLAIGMVVHPILFFIRCYFDKTHDAYTAEYFIYYDSYKPKVADDPPNQGYLGHADRLSDDRLKFQPWDQFVEDREHYYRLPLKD